MTVDFLIMLPLTLCLFLAPIQMDQGSKCCVRSIMTFKGRDVGSHYSFEANKVFTNSLFSESS